MAFSAHKNDEQMKERFEAVDSVQEKAEKLADLIKSSHHFIAFTGAGVSTSAGIPDFRGPQGVWTLMAQGKSPSASATDVLQALPTPTHMALVELQNRGVLKYLVSQNTDGLHRKSGILPDKISELHGNANREYCSRCGKEYIRDFRAIASHGTSLGDHRTGRKCTRCRGDLMDSIIHFGENLPEDALQRAFEHAHQADLCLSLGSSLTVTPAATVPQIVGKKGDAVLSICNLQNTPMDQFSDIRIYSTTDDLLTRVMAILAIPIPPFLLYRWLKVTRASQELIVEGVDVDGTPTSFLRSVLFNDSTFARVEPFACALHRQSQSGLEVKLELEFMGHYGEPNLEIVSRYEGNGDLERMYRLVYNPALGEWQTSIDGPAE